MQTLIKIGVELLEALFFLGMFGSALVIFLVTIEDIAVLLGREEGEAASE